jgi:hypothetical protein
MRIVDLIYRAFDKDVVSWKFPEYPDNWDSVRKNAYRRAGHSCERCGSSTSRLHAHHRVSLSKGGSNDLYNIECLCENCHTSEHPHMRGKSDYYSANLFHNNEAIAAGVSELRSRAANELFRYVVIYGSIAALCIPFYLLFQNSEDACALAIIPSGIILLIVSSYILFYGDKKIE